MFLLFIWRLRIFVSKRLRSFAFWIVFSCLGLMVYFGSVLSFPKFDFILVRSKRGRIFLFLWVLVIDRVGSIFLFAGLFPAYMWKVSMFTHKERYNNFLVIGL